jgi:hypothetical protein
VSLLPDPVPLDPPPGRADAVLAAADRAAAAARSLDELAERLTTAGTPAWHGADAAAAGERRVRIARLADDAAGALHRAAARLRGHADVLGEVATRTTVLRAAQDAEFAAARSRVAVPFDPLDPLAPEPAVVIGELRAADETRGTEYRLLAARLADDTAHTVRVLAGCTALIGGTPRWNSDVALLRLAALLPAWGTPEVARRGHLLALALREGDIESDDIEATFAADAPICWPASCPAWTATRRGRRGWPPSSTTPGRPASPRASPAASRPCSHALRSWGCPVRRPPWPWRGRGRWRSRNVGRAFPRRWARGRPAPTPRPPTRWPSY